MVRSQRGGWVCAATSGRVRIGCTKMLCRDREEASRLLGGACRWRLQGETLIVPSGEYRIVMRRAKPLIGGPPDQRLPRSRHA